jgi:hypothetical protein
MNMKELAAKEELGIVFSSPVQSMAGGRGCMSFPLPRPAVPLGYFQTDTD